MSYFRDASFSMLNMQNHKTDQKKTTNQSPFFGIRSNFSFYLYRLQVGQNRSSSHNSSHWWRESERWVPFVLVTQLQSLVGAWRLPQGMRCLCLAWQLGILCSESWSVKTSDSELWWWEGLRDPMWELLLLTDNFTSSWLGSFTSGCSCENVSSFNKYLGHSYL